MIFGPHACTYVSESQLGGRHAFGPCARTYVSESQLGDTLVCVHDLEHYIATSTLNTL